MQQYLLRKYLFDVGPVFREYNGILVIPYVVKKEESVYYPVVVVHPQCPFWHQTGTLTCIPAGTIESQAQQDAPVTRCLGPATVYRMLGYCVEMCEIQGNVELTAQCVERTLHYAESIKMCLCRRLQRFIAAVRIQRTFRKMPQKMFEASS